MITRLIMLNMILRNEKYEIHRGLSVLVVVIVCASKAAALSVGNANSSSPLTINYNTQLESSIDPILELVNDSAAADVVLSWQLQLAIQPLPGAHGQLLFQSTFTPPNSLFGDLPGPISDLTMAASTLLAFDSDTTVFTGVPIPNHAPRNIIGLSLHGSADASGTFQILMAQWDPATSNGSSWFPADATDPIGFDNDMAGAQGFVALGTVNVSSGSLAGDYDRDGAVGPQDYQQWRNTFSLPVNSPGEGADGNQNSTVDSADYVVWRANTTSGQLVGGPVGTGSLPEPAASGVLILSACVAWTYRFQRCAAASVASPYIYMNSAH